MDAISRQSIKAELDKLGVDWDVEEDAQALVELLSQCFDALSAWVWLCFPTVDDETPLTLLEHGEGRRVFAEARRLCAMVAT